MPEQKIPYICGPLTELSPGDRRLTKLFYEAIADVCQEVLGARAFVPHEHYDPVRHASFTSQQVDEAERRQVTEGTSVLVVVTIAPSWGGGIEVEMANQSGVPVVLVVKRTQLEARRVSRLLRGNPAVRSIVLYDSERGALNNLRQILPQIVANQPASA